MNRVLLVEDDPATARIYENHLVLEDYEVRVVKNSREGLDQLKAFQPDAVVLDLMLPNLSGLDFIKSVRSDEAFKKLPILVISNASGTDVVREALRQGATKFLTKYNCPPKQLVEALRRTISEPSQVGRVVFPSVPPPTPQAPSAPAKAPEGTETRQNLGGSLLMLEDNDAFAEVLTLFLESQSFRITRVTNGVDGLREISATDFDAILCDMVLPSMTGDLFYEAVESVKPHLRRRFVFMTGNRGEPKWEAFVKKVGGIILWKPFPLSSLLAALRTVSNKERGTTISSHGNQNQNMPSKPGQGNGWLDARNARN